MYKASIIVSVDNTYPLLNHFFSGLEDNCNLNDYELIVINDCCQNKESITYLNELHLQGVIDILINLPKKLGFGKANNIGFKKSHGMLLYFINTDIIFKKGTLEKLAFDMEQTQADALQPLLLYPQTGLIQSAGHIFGYLFNRHAYDGNKVDHLKLNAYIRRQALTLAFCVIKRNAFEKAGGFNESYYNAYEGLELTHRISNFGKCVLSTNTQAYHIKSVSRKDTELDEEQQLALFWHNNAKTIKQDYIDIIKNQLSIEERELSYIAIVSTHLDLLNHIELAGLHISEIIEKKQKGKIELFNNIPQYYLKISTPILFICDNFTQLSGNLLWYQIRNKSFDLVIDSNGNVIKFCDLY